jgi:NAD(P)-dependent dehydrogenase (short-subunit alcohol dehydrogenase family)
MDRLVGKSGLVVDGSGRLGRPAALALAREGARVSVADRDPRSGAETVAAIEREGGTANRVLLDPLDPTSSDRAVAEVVERFGRLDVLCNPPAPVPIERKRLHEVSESEWDAAMAACITRAIVPARSALRVMKEHGGGSVIFVVSAAALVGVPLLSAFSAAEGVLATSRAALRGEREYRVAPLELPDQDASPATLARSAAATLFLERARAAGVEAEPDAATAPIVVEICHRLDGLPPAIELAAAWARLKSAGAACAPGAPPAFAGRRAARPAGAAEDDA